MENMFLAFSVINFYFFHIFLFVLCFKEFQGFLENPRKKLQLLNHSTLALILKSLKMVPLSLPWNSRIFEVKEIFPLKFLSYPQPWKPSKCFVKPTLDLELTLNFEDKVKDPRTSRLQLPSLHTMYVCIMIMLRGVPRNSSIFIKWRNSN